MTFVGKICAKKKEDKINTNFTEQDLQETKLFHIMYGEAAIIKTRILMSARNLIYTRYEDIRLAFQNYASPKKRVVTAERTKFLSIIQDVGESEDNLLPRRREEARFCDSEKLKTAANID